MESSRDLTEAALFARANAAIAHADDKYAGAWNIYVFVSDGLFYSGICAKLSRGHKCGPQPAGTSPNEHPHNACMDSAKKIVAIALTVAYAHWLGEREQDEWTRVRTQSGNATAALDREMPDNELQSLLWVFLGEWQKAKHLPATSQSLLAISTLKTDRYVHGDPRNEFTHFANCHDIGYKCDREVNLVKKTPADVFDGDGDIVRFADMLIQLFDAPEKGLGESEFRELFQRHRRRPYLADAMEAAREKTAAREPEHFHDYLKRLMRSDLFEDGTK